MASFTLKSVKFKARKRPRAQYVVGTNAIILSETQEGREGRTGERKKLRRNAK